jgi:pilus assembly protein CpaE
VSPAPDELRPAEAGERAPRVVAFVRDDASEGTVANCLAGLGIGDARLLRLDIDGAIRDLGETTSPALLIVDISGEGEPVGKLRQLAEVCDHHTSVIVIGDHNDIRLYRMLKELGATEYFFKPVLPDLLTRACRAALTGEDPEPAPQTGKLVSVLGVRGGVGATTVAVNVAWHLAEHLRRRVALIDLNVMTGDAALQLDKAPNEAFSEALRDPDRVDGVFLDRIVTRVSDRFDLLASLEPLGSAAPPEEATALALLPKIRDGYRYVLVDVPGSAWRGWHRLLDLSAAVVLVSDETIASAREVARWRERLSGIGAGRAILHVLNKADGPGALSAREFAGMSGGLPDVVIPFDVRIAAAGKLGVAAIEKCRRMRPGLARLDEMLSGEASAPWPSLLARFFTRRQRRDEAKARVPQQRAA